MIRCPHCGAEVPAGFRFCGYCAKSLGHDPDAPGPLATRAERRKVAVLFADLQGYTSLSERKDPEDVATFLDALFRDFSAVIERHGGYVDKYLGDAVMALFGAPLAHEDDIEQAIRAGLALVRVARQTSSPQGEQLHLRVGVHYGEVVAGTLGAGVGAGYSVTGDTANTAARLQEMAPPNTVLVTERVYRTICPIARALPAMEVVVKGKRSPIKARVIESIEPRSRRGFARSPFVGRQAEVDRLSGAAKRIATGLGVGVLLEGEAGVGKSRLIEEFVAGLTANGWLHLAGRGEPLGAPFGPFRTVLVGALSREGLEIDPLDPWITLERLAGNQNPELVRGLISLLGIDPGKSGNGEDPGHEVRALALERALTSQARGRPMSILIEDLHWVDADTLALLEDLVHRLGRMGMLLILTSRPPVSEFLSSACLEGLDRIRLAPLDPISSHELARSIGRRVEVDLSDLARRSAGNPLFLEELVAAAAERVEELPDSIHALIQSRLDRLPPGPRSAIRCASILGIDFSREVLRALYARTNQAPGFEADVDFLLERELLVQPDDATLAFRHALVREVAYGTELRSERRRLHGLAAETIEAVWEGDLTPASLLAHHYSEAADWVRAVPHLLTAGHAALSQYAVQEAGKWLEKAAGAMERKRVKMDPGTRARLWRDLAESRLQRAELTSALDAADELALTARELGCHDLLACSHLLRGQILWSQDRSLDARDEFEKGLAIAPETAAARADLLNACGVACSLGDLEEGLGEARLREALHLWAQAGNRLGEAKASVNLGNLMVAQERLDNARSWYDRTLAIGRAIHDPMVVVINLANRGMVQFWRGEYTGALESLRESHELARELGLRQHVLRITENLGRCHLAKGDFKTAAECFDSCLQCCRELDSPGSWALLYLGRTYFAAMDTDRARDLWQECEREIAAHSHSEIEAEWTLDQARAAWLDGDVERTQELLQTTLRKTVEGRNAPLRSVVQGFLWLVDARRGRPPSGKPRTSGRQPLAALLAFQAGRAHLERGRSDRAMERLSRAAVVVDAIGAHRLGRHVHLFAHRAALQVGSDDVAASHLSRARELTSRVLEQLPAGVSRSQYARRLPPELSDLTVLEGVNARQV